jgi:hypothetical protein
MATNQSSEIDLINQALQMVNLAPIDTLDDTTDIARQAYIEFDRAKAKTLWCYENDFPLREIKLTSDDNGGFYKPADMLKAVSPKPSKIIGNKLYFSYPLMVAFQYITNTPNDADLTEEYKAAVVYEMATSFALDFKKDLQLSEIFRARAEKFRVDISTRQNYWVK